METDEHTSHGKNSENNWLEPESAVLAVGCGREIQIALPQCRSLTHEPGTFHMSAFHQLTLYLIVHAFEGREP